MKTGSSTLALFLLFAPETAAFFAPVPPRDTTALFGYRQSYQYSLEQFTKTGKIEIDGKQVSLNDAAQKIDEDLQASQAQEAEAQQRLSYIQEQISDKEQEQAAEAREAEIQKQQMEMELEAKYKGMSEEAILAANKEKEAAIAEFQARELQLQREMDLLNSKLEEEKDHVRQNQDMTNRILATRIELDTELGNLKKKYTSEVREWQSKLEAEKVAHDSDVAKAQAEVEKLKREVEEMAKERTSLSSLFKQSMKVMFGMDE